MIIRCWGARGSIPVSGKEFKKYGGDTTCIEIRTKHDDIIIIDAGTGIRRLGNRLLKENRKDINIIFTHYHWDHVQGFPFFTPLFNPAAQFEIWAVERDGESLRSVLDRQMSRPMFPVTLDILPATLQFESIAAAGVRCVGGVEVRWAEMWHPSGSTAYRVTHEGCSVVVSGDVEVQQGCGRDLVELARGADVLIMDAQYFPDEYESRRGWGHSTPADAVSTALEAGVSRVVMTHHDPSHDDTRLEAKLRLARELARGTGLVVDNAHDRMTIHLGEAGTRAAA